MIAGVKGVAVTEHCGYFVKKTKGIVTLKNYEAAFSHRFLMAWADIVKVKARKIIYI
ncbi:hypothetical protein [Vitreoscilla stercoraria]|uniref:hypothetical protein n=1 Tax=Vitreoscilla stercoraria TaxID=61 RepID=UPI0015990FDA|nr:hypothetical protein [Vitreoscilla stercoraria]QJQ52325.1 hypothetical protein ADP71_40610 [Vitreoscilla sp. C1]